MHTTVVVPPSGSVCTLDAVKAHLRVGHGSDDTLLTELRAAATARVEALTGLALIERTLRLEIRDWDGRVIALRPAPVTSLASVEVVDSAGVSEDVTARFALEHGRPAIVCRKPGAEPVSVPAGGRLEVTFVSGFGTGPDDVPDDLILAVKLVAAHLYEDRSGERPLPPVVLDTLRPWMEARL